MRTLPVLFVLISLPMILAGCDCGGTPGNTCTSDSECASGQRCVDGVCRAVPDSGGRDTGTGCIDRDSDGRCPPDDCDDDDPRVGGAEVCDELDNDCDGAVDEGIPELCRDCTPGCAAHAIPGPGGWMPTEENSEGVIVDEDGALTLGRNEARAFAVWVANQDEGTVSKLDSRTGREVARYPTVGSMAPAGARPWNEFCNWSNTGNCPSRTAVDQNFDAYVANRAFGNQGTVTKYANRESDCIDRNANGVIDTSRDLNDDGIIEIGTEEFVGPDDECILWTVAVGANNGWPRALAVGLAPPDRTVGDVWVGLFNHEQACRLDPTTGATIACIDIAGFNPYGMAADSAGRIWAVDRSNDGRRDVLGYVDAAAMTFHPVEGLPNPTGSTCAIPYGVTVDGSGDVFFANQCRPGVWRYRPSTHEWTPIEIVGPNSPRGVAADESSLWVAISHAGDQYSGGLGNRVLRYNLADLSLVGEYTLPTGLGPVGIGVSFDGSVWAVCQGNNLAGRFDPTSGSWTEHPVGLTPYTYSDFIGFGLNVFAEPRGHYRFVVEGCAEGHNQWLGARYAAEVPPETEVALFARTADTREGLASEPWVGPFTGNPARFTDPPGPLAPRRYLEVEIRLSTMDRRAAPRVFGIDVAGVCEPIID